MPVHHFNANIRLGSTLVITPQHRKAGEGMGRRETNSSGLGFLCDDRTMIGWSETGASYNFTTVPGGGSLAGSFTANGTTTTWVPLLDASGSTIGLVNAANVNAGPVTTYTYDPSGTPSVTGSANDWPFQYNGMEKELTDPSTYYYTGLGQFYSPQLSRSLSEVGETSSSQGACPSGNDIGAPSGSSGSGLSIPSCSNCDNRRRGCRSGCYDWCNHWSFSRQSTSWLCYWRGSRCYCRWLSELLRRPLWWRQPSAYAPAAPPAAPVVPGDHGGF